MSLLLRRRSLAGAVNHPDDGRWCYAIGTNGEVLTSSDYGLNWTNRTNYGCADRANRVLVDNYGNGFFFLSNGTVYRSLRGEAPQQVTATGVGKSYSPCMFTGSGFFATNAGSSWQTGYQATINKFTAGTTVAASAVTSFSTWDQVADSASACSRDGKYIIFGGKESYTNGFVSRDGGASWAEALATSSYGNGIGDAAMSADGQFTVLLGPTNPNIVFSTDYLATFRTVAKTADGVDITADGTKAFIVGSTGVYEEALTAGMTTITLSKQISSIGMRRIGCSARGVRLCGIGFSNNYIYMSKDRGNTWTQTSVQAVDVKVYKRFN